MAILAAKVRITIIIFFSAANIRSKMDPSVNPCDDFYAFACGSWMRTTVIPEDEGNTGTLFKVDDDVFIKLKCKCLVLRP